MNDFHPRTYPDIDRALAAFADELEAAGFRVYRPGATWHFIGFAREVDGKWLSATVQASEFHNHDGWQWSMNIVPSQEDGSGMYLNDVPNGTPLTVETATNVTRPSAINDVLSQVRRNAGWPSHWNPWVKVQHIGTDHWDRPRFKVVETATDRVEVGQILCDVNMMPISKARTLHSITKEGEPIGPVNDIRIAYVPKEG